MTLGKEPALNRRRNTLGFSLIEILVVIGLIAVLSTMLLIGISKLQTSSKRQQTRLALQNLSSLYSEWDAVNRHHFINYQDVNTGVFNVDVAAPCPQNMTVLINPPLDPKGFDCRQGKAVLAARDMMAQLEQMPTSAASLGKMSASSFMTIQTTLLPTPTPLPATAWDTTGATTYAIGSRVYILGPKDAFNHIPWYYFTAVAINWVPPSASNPTGTQTVPQPSPPDARFWLPATPDANDPNPSSAAEIAQSLTVPVLLDGWGNPIIFVPGGILGSGAALATAGTPDVKAGYPIPLSGAIASNPGANGISIQVKSPDGRPFWASAGPDGDFSLGDDNMYSFEK